MQKKNGFLQEVFKSNSSEVIEDYKTLKENIGKTEILCSQPKTAYQYAEIRVKSNK